MTPLRMPVKQVWNVVDAQPCLFLMQINLENAVFVKLVIPLLSLLPATFLIFR